MCDTMAALAAATVTGGTLFAKNSDRERNEAQFLQHRPAARYGAGAVLRATYLAIPQVARTHAVLLSRPYWMWGAEMGVNEHGVAIGNEAVHPRLKPSLRPALLGMDLLRLGLERGETAAAAVEVITSLLERFGQGGNCSFSSRRSYDNSFIVADHREVFVVETVGRHWAVQRAPAVRAISNTYTIGADIDRCSDGLQDFAREKGWWKRGAFDFAAAVTNPDNPGLPSATTRCGRAGALLTRDQGHLTPAHMMAILRDHGADAGPDWHPQDATGGSVCAHAADGARRGQSVGSLVSDLRPGGAVHWVTGGSAPCTAIFKPVFIEDGLPDQGPLPGGAFDADTLWWRHEALHRAALTDFSEFQRETAEERTQVEADFARRLESARGGTANERKRLVESCWREASRIEAAWQRRIRGRDTLRPAYRASWQRHDRLAGAPLTCAPTSPALAAE